GGSYYSADYIIDVLNARAALQSSDIVSPGKIGLWGHSMAGNVLLRSLASSPDIPAIVIWAGAVYTYEDMQEYGIDDNSYRPPPSNTERQRKRQELFDTHGQFDPNSPFWKQIIATNYLGGINGAIQLNHAADDSVVSIEYSRNLKRILAKTEIVHELNEYSSGGHNMTGNSFNQAMQNTVEFFREKL
ncbi:MAG: acyl-CoA thioester hydrolase/BAAT C-terminal domain-containing protein, partial [Candidatus Levyibacteriota bacterium]